MTTDSAVDLDLARVIHAALGKLLELGPADTESEKLLFEPEEAALQLGLRSSNWLYKRSAERSIPCTYLAGRLMFSRLDLQQIVEMHGQGKRPGDTGRKPRPARATRQH